MEKLLFLCIHFTLLLMHSLLCSLATAASSISADQTALLDLKDHIPFGPNHVLAKNWSADSSVCDWIGVTCGSPHYRVMELNISNMGLEGTIPPQLGNISFLVSLDLRGNNFNGSIPKELARLQRLKLLHLGSNELSGSIPFEIFNISTLENIVLQVNGLSGGLPDDLCRRLPRLKILGLSYNKLSGPLPSTLSQCLQLQELYMVSNNFNGILPKGLGNLNELKILNLARNRLEGVIPAEISNLTNLIALALGDNMLTGAIPRDLGNLDNLVYLSLWNNSLNGSIPDGIFNISSMRIVQLSVNSFSGKLPSAMGYGLPNLEEFYMSSNQVSGPISLFSNSSRLRLLDLGSNHLTGTIPLSFRNLRSLEKLALSGNMLTRDSSTLEMEFITSLSNSNLTVLDLGDNPLNGVLPKSIGNFSKISDIVMFGCGILGDIPAEIGNLTSLTLLYLNDNQLTGPLPNSITSMQQLQRLSFGRNKLSGLVLNNLCGLKRLGELDLSNNMFSGPIPKCIGNITSLRNLSLSSNRWNSVIPINLWNLKDLVTLDLSSNFISGFLAPEVGNLKALAVLNLAMNNLSGDLPNTMGSLQNLQHFSVVRNLLEGYIPDSVGKMLALETLDLSQNKFSGIIPLSFENLQYMKHFNVSYNNLTGSIPSKGPFKNFSSESFMFNKALCGEQKFHVPPCLDLSLRRSWAKGLHHILLLSLSIAGFIVASAVGILYLIYRKKDTARVEEELSPVAKSNRISYYELQRATQGYAERNLLGQGSFGSVYKGILKDGRVIAVKVFNIQTERALKSFVVECQVLRNLRHRNITRVISICTNEDFRALVLEFMPNGNLENWLHSGNHFLSFMERLSIMIDVACALQYLHSGYSIPVVHSDLKPSNVLLDSDMVAHVSDFGISKMLIEESICHTNTLGTFGYIAPEHGSEGLVSTKCDVYSYGIMLMEVFTSKRPDDKMSDGNLTLRDWVNQSIEIAVPEVIADDILRRFEKENSAAILECLSMIMHVALNCTKAFPSERSDIGDVLVSLNKIKLKISEDLSLNVLAK